MNRRLLVDLEALAANYRQFLRAASGAEVGAVVKADGYGLGASRVAGRLIDAGCRSLFVASCEEALALAGTFDPQPDIYVFEGPTAATADALATAGIVPVINHPAQLECWRSHAGHPIAVHVDTGLARLGFPSEVTPDVFAGFQIDLLMTHLACADEPDHVHNDLQIQRFDQVRARFPQVRTSIGNSAGILSSPQRLGDLGRPGIGLYGGNPFAAGGNQMAPVATLQGRILQVRELPAGSPVGYGATVSVKRSTRVAVLAIGYADGLPRLLSGNGAMAVNGQRCPILGRISMDMTMIDVTDCRAEPDDWVECFGATVTVDEVAVWADTIAYEVLTGIGPRVARQYLQDPSSGG